MKRMSEPLIDVDTLARHGKQMKVYDVRWKLGAPDQGRRDYLAAHIPGAVFVDLDEDLSSTPGENGRHPLPTPERFVETLGRLGLGANDHALVYDDSAGTVAARMWWMLRSIGHSNVSVLDGGFQAWIESGGELEAGDQTPVPTTYPGPATFQGTVMIDELAGRNVIDVRAPERFNGEHEPVDPRPGHIPGAKNFPVTMALRDGRFVDAGLLRETYQPIEEPVVSCGSGVNACHTALAMVAAGLEMPDVYIGSFSEWSRSGRPVALGPDPE